MRRSSINEHPRAAESDEPTNEPMTNNSLRRGSSDYSSVWEAESDEAMTTNSRPNYPQLQLPKRETESSCEPKSEIIDVILQRERIYFHKRQHSRKLILKKQKGGYNILLFNNLNNLSCF